MAGRQSKNSRSSRKVTNSYQPKVRKKKEVIWLEVGTPREREVHQMQGALAYKTKFGKEYALYNNPALSGQSRLVDDK